MLWAILMRKHAFPTADLCLKALDFLHFEIISSCNISLRSFLTLEMNKIVMLKVWRISYHQVFHFISAIITLVDLHRNWLNWCHILNSHRKSTPYSDGLHDFLVIIPRCYKDDHVNSFFPATFGLCNSVPTECFSVTCDLNDHKFRVNGTLLSLGSGKQLYCMLLIFFFLFL